MLICNKNRIRITRSCINESSLIIIYEVISMITRVIRRISLNNILYVLLFVLKAFLGNGLHITTSINRSNTLLRFHRFNFYNTRFIISSTSAFLSRINTFLNRFVLFNINILVVRCCRFLNRVKNSLCVNILCASNNGNANVKCENCNRAYPVTYYCNDKNASSDLRVSKLLQDER